MPVFFPRPTLFFLSLSLNPINAHVTPNGILFFAKPFFSLLSKIYLSFAFPASFSFPLSPIRTYIHINDPLPISVKHNILHAHYSVILRRSCDMHARTHPTWKGQYTQHKKKKRRIYPPPWDLRLKKAGEKRKICPLSLNPTLTQAVRGNTRHAGFLPPENMPDSSATLSL